MQGFNHFVAKN